MTTNSKKPCLYKRMFYPEHEGPYKVFMEYARVIFVALLIAFVFRTFVASPYKIPSSSMMPTLLVGDYLFVSKYSYGIPILFSDGERWHKEMPKRGDIIVFKKHLSTGGEQNYIKRVIAVPGDMIAYKNKQVILNDEPLALEHQGHHSYEYHDKMVETEKFTEQLDGFTHPVLHQDDIGQDVEPMRVPPNHLVVMGDNRDSSYDSRFWHYPSWGFVSMNDVVGRAEFIFWSWDEHAKPRPSRIATTLRRPAAEQE